MVEQGRETLERLYQSFEDFQFDGISNAGSLSLFTGQVGKALFIGEYKRQIRGDSDWFQMFAEHLVKRVSQQSFVNLKFSVGLSGSFFFFDYLWSNKL